MADRTRTMPGVVTGAELEARSLCSPPWINRQTAARPMVAPGPSYPALVLGALGTAEENTICDGHHRCYLLLDQGWKGRVPVVHRSGRWLHGLVADG